MPSSVRSPSLRPTPRPSTTCPSCSVRSGGHRHRCPRCTSQLPYKAAKAKVIENWEAAYLAAAFARAGHNLSATARTLGLSRSHLRKLLRDHGLVDGPDGTPV
ncbi:MAG: helix-turn-helix domain-containing protein [Myxococcota bacterium]